MSGIREEFEAWLYETGRDAYDEGVKNALYAAWQASRAALKVELPPTITVEEAAEHFNIDEEGIDMAVDVAHMVNGAIAACAAFIKQAGIEVMK